MFGTNKLKVGQAGYGCMGIKVHLWEMKTTKGGPFNIIFIVPKAGTTVGSILPPSTIDKPVGVLHGGTTVIGRSTRLTGGSSPSTQESAHGKTADMPTLLLNCGPHGLTAEIQDLDNDYSSVGGNSPSVP